MSDHPQRAGDRETGAPEAVDDWSEDSLAVEVEAWLVGGPQLSSARAMDPVGVLADDVPELARGSARVLGAAIAADGDDADIHEVATMISSEMPGRRTLRLPLQAPSEREPAIEADEELDLAGAIIELEVEDQPTSRQGLPAQALDVPTIAPAPREATWTASTVPATWDRRRYAELALAFAAGVALTLVLVLLLA